MFSLSNKIPFALLCFSGMAFAASLLAGDCLLKERGRLAIAGDSITEQKLYSSYIETYLTVCHPEMKLDVGLFGKNGERASDFLARMDNDMLSWFSPSVVTICYGMNDGRYSKITPDIEKAYEKPSRKILEKFKGNNITAVFSGPGAVDTKYFRPGTDLASVYNENLATLSGIAAKIAPEYGAVCIPLHKTMMEVMAKAKDANGENFPVCGSDGIHPNGDGHLVMAYAFLKALGVEGAIAMIDVDFKDKSATLSDGHKLLSFDNGVLAIESSRYPFCFHGGAKSPETAAMLPFIPFNAELNRFMLKVSNLPWKSAKVTWGTNSRTFTKDDLEKGINLADAFVDANPFKEAFSKVSAAVVEKQRFESTMINAYLYNFPRLANDPLFKEIVKDFKTRLIERREKLVEAKNAAAIPVRHSIKIENAEEG